MLIEVSDEGTSFLLYQRRRGAKTLRADFFVYEYIPPRAVRKEVCSEYYSLKGAINMRIKKPIMSKDCEKMYFMTEADELLRKGRNAKRSERYGHTRGRGRLVNMHTLDRGDIA